MKNISTDLKNALKKDSVVERDYIIITGTTDRIYLWFKYYDDCYKDGNIVQNFIMKRIEFDYTDNDIDFKKKEFKAYKEYKLEDGTFESICYGSFIVTDIEQSDTKESVKVTAYDYALKFANTYITDLDYASGNITLLDVLNECCTKCGVQTGLTSFANSDFIVDSNQFEDTAQFGNVISAIAGISGSFAKIINDQLCLVFTNNTDIVIDTNDYEEFEDKRDTHPITIIGLGISNIEGENVVQRWEDGITQYGENYMMINDNPFAYTQEKRQQLLPALFSKIKGFAYSAMTLKNCLYPYLECGDKVKVKNSAGELVDTIVLRVTSEDVQYTLEAPSETSATVTYKNQADALTIAKRTEIIVDKQNKTITSLAQQQDEHSQQLAQQKISINEINNKVSNVQEFSRDCTGTYQLVTENAGNVNIMSFELDAKTELKTYAGLFFAGAEYAISANNKITLVVDKNSRGNISSDARIKEYITPVLLSKDDICDKFVVEINNNNKNTVKVLKYVKFEDGHYITLNTPEEIILDSNIDLQLFEGINYIYIKEHKNWQMSAKYLVKNDFNKYYATRVEMNSKIEQSADEINLEVGQKVNENEVISAINLSPESAEIDSNKISLKGKKIDLTADNVSIASDKFNVDKNGNMKCTDAEINGGDITLKNAGDSNPKLEIYDTTNVSLGTLNIGDDLNGRTLTMNFPVTSVDDDTNHNTDWYEILKTDNGNYIKNFVTRSEGGAETITIFYKNSTATIYDRYMASITANLNSYVLPEDFGKVVSIGSSLGPWRYIKIDNIHNKTTQLASTGITIYDKNNNINTSYKSNGLSIKDENGIKAFDNNGISWQTEYGPDFTEFSVAKDFLIMLGRAGTTMLYMDTSTSDRNNDFLKLEFSGNSQAMKVDKNGITTTSLTQVSRKEYKKNFEKYKNALTILKNIDIYKYNLKSEKDGTKKHIGFIIGDDYNYSKELTNNDNTGVDAYTVASYCLQAIKEQQQEIEQQQEQIETLKKEIEELKGVIKDVQKNNLAK